MSNENAVLELQWKDFIKSKIMVGTKEIKVEGKTNDGRYSK